MLDNDIPESRLREATLGRDTGQTCADVTSGLDQPDTGGRSELKPTCVRSVLIGLKDLCRENGINEVFTAYMVGRLALGLCDVDPPPYKLSRLIVPVIIHVYLFQFVSILS